MSDYDWMPEEARRDWENARQETKDYITERVRDGFIEPGTFVEEGQASDWVNANNRYNTIANTGWRSRVRRNGNVNLSGEEIANVDATIGELNAMADAMLESQGFYKNDGVWYDRYNRECNDRGERY